MQPNEKEHYKIWDPNFSFNSRISIFSEELEINVQVPTKELEKS